MKTEIVLPLIFFVFTVIAALAGGVWAFTTEKRLKKLFMGKKGKDLEDTIVTLEQEVSELRERTDDLIKKADEMNAKLKKSIRGLETIRFNPFPDQGGNQSFAIGILNEEGSGVVLSSLYSRERMSIFAKPVKNHKSEYELSSEEKEVLKKAKVE